LTLADLGGRELSPGMVSKIERDLVTPSLHALQYLAERLRVPLSTLFEHEQQRAAAAAATALRCAQALLWLGDPAAAVSAAEAGLQEAAPPVARARLLGVAAEAQLAAGAAPTAAELVLEASRLAGTSDTAPNPAEAGADWAARQIAHAHLAWLLGVLERRRGEVGQAERSWSRCLDALDRLGVGAATAAEAALIRGQALAELGSLAELAGALETARHCHGRAADLLRRFAEPASAARVALAGAVPAAGAVAAAPATALAGAEPAAEVAAALAAVAVAARLAERAEREVWRLERAALPPPATVPVPSVPHSRHLS
jgi:transcriptional regulator with XRE-family HTH domain